LLLFLASILKTHLAPHLPLWPGTYFWWHRIAPAEHSGTAALAMLLGGSLWIPLNLFGSLGSFFPLRSNVLGRAVKALGDEEAVKRAIVRKRDSLELFLTIALEAEKMISVSIQNGKVYVGYLTSSYNPAFPMESISLIPAFSGHRREDTKEMVLDLNYLEVYKAIQPDLYEKLLTAFLAELAEKPKASEARFFTAVMQRLAFDAGQDYEVILPIGEVQSANVFHVDSYIKYFTTGAYKIPSAAVSPESTLSPPIDA